METHTNVGKVVGSGETNKNCRDNDGAATTIAKKVRRPSCAHVILGVLLFAVLSSPAMAWFTGCRQNGGPNFCTPIIDNGWEYKWEIRTGGGPCSQTTHFTNQGPDVSALYAEVVADYNAWIAACVPEFQIPAVPGTCTPTPTYSTDPPHISIHPCTCDVVPSAGFPVYVSSEVFSKVHPYCAPFTVLVGGGYCNSKPYYCVHYPGWEPKNLGEPSCGISAGNPINAATGNKYQRDVDYAGVGAFPLSVIRHYNSLGTSRGPFGKSWRGDFERSIVYDSGGTVPVAMAYRPDGKIYLFTQSGSNFVGDIDVPDRLVRDTDGSGNVMGWRYKTAADETESYGPTGLLLQIADRSGRTMVMQYDQQNRLSAIVDSFGRRASFAFDTQDRIASFTDPDGRPYAYQYNADGMMSQVRYPDGVLRKFTYNEPGYTAGVNLPSALTGIIDENGGRFAIIRYDVDGQAISTSHVATGGTEVDRYDVSHRVSFDTTGNATVIDPLGTSRTHNFQFLFGTTRNTSISQPCSTCGEVSATTAYDTATGAVTSRTDFNGAMTTYQHTDPYGRNDLETQRVEAVSRPEQRTVTTQWHPTFRLPSSISEPAPGGTKTTTFTYDASGNLTQKSIVAPKNDGTSATTTRTWSWTYTTLGRMLTATDPDNHPPTTYNYYSDTDTDLGKRGNVQTITNPAGHVTQITAYDAHGRPLSSTEPNGLVTTLAYDLRGRLVSRQVGVEVTHYDYDGVGQLTLVTQPDGSSLRYTYDAAHRLTQLSDGLGNRIVYTLDAMGNRTQEDSYLAGSSTPTKIHGRRFDALNRLSQELNAAGQVVAQYGYDGNGNLKQTTIKPDTTGTHDQVSVNTYDALNRLLQVRDPAQKATTYAHDPANNLSRVTDARTLSTTYGYDGLNNLVRQLSPDTGTTTNTYDTAGNLQTRTDARGVAAAYTYDLLNRVSKVIYSKSGTPNETHTFGYDSGANAKGRLTQLTDPAATTSWTYSAQGRVASKTQTIGSIALTLSYGYNAVGQLVTLTTPSGQQIGYTYLNNRVVALAVNGAALAGGIVTTPFGPVGAWQWGNGLYTFRHYDTDGRLSAWEFVNGATVLRKEQSVDLAGRIVGIADPNNPAVSQSYQYDALDRLTVAQSGSPVAHTQQFNYDAVGNRQNATIDGAIANLTYGTASNRLQFMTGVVSPSYFNGATALIFTYNNANRLTQVQSGGTPLASYAVNALGQRVRKDVGATTTLFVYDEQGRLLGEYDGSGQLIQETVWLDDLPIATLRPTGTGTPTPIAIHYVHADHLGSPRAISRPSDNALLWRWDNTDPFGNNAANENPAGLGTFKYELRFPGQYYDAETGTHYNYFRDYDPAVGRYEQSDPIGLRGGINTYGYVGANPIIRTDPRGLLFSGHHYRCSYEAFNGTSCGSTRFAERVAQATMNVDTGTQGASDAYKHGMCDTTDPNSPNDGMQRIGNYIQSELGSCTLQGLANALHAIQDLYASGHRNCAPWGGGTPGRAHLFGDASQFAAAEACAASKAIVSRWMASCGKRCCE